jgi:hypothetical protein
MWASTSQRGENKQAKKFVNISAKKRDVSMRLFMERSFVRLFSGEPQNEVLRATVPLIS